MKRVAKFAMIYRVLLAGFLMIVPTVKVRAQQPPLPINALFKPTFLFMDDSFCAGTSFVIAGSANKTLLLTPDHLFGPDGGLNAQMPPADIASQIRGVAGLSMEDQSSICTAPKYAKIDDAAPLESGRSDKDLAVFYVDHAPGGSFRLSDADPKIGDKVWMYARLRGTDKPQLFSATVSVVEDTQLQYLFDDATIKIPGTSGAPILNTKGEVVGMNLGGGPTKDKNGLYGVANPVSSLRKEIATYVK